MGLLEREGLSEYEGKSKLVSEYAKSRPRDEKGRFINDGPVESMEEYYQWDRTKWVIVKDADHVIYERRTYILTDNQKIGIACTCVFLLLVLIF